MYLIFMVSSSDLKYKFVRHVTFNPLLFWIAPGLISCIFMKYFLFFIIQCGTLFSKHFSLYNFLSF